MKIPIKRILIGVVDQYLIHDAIRSGKVLINNKVAFLNQKADKFDTITYQGNIIQQGLSKTYIAYNKPRGIESTLNPKIPNSLVKHLNFPEKLFPLGRLDKESEGLMLLTNDGEIYDKVVNSKSEKEKEYLVRVDKILTPEFIKYLQEGVFILGQLTKKCIVIPHSEYSFHIILTQGLNRQIRRMCYKSGYNVIFLRRIRIMNIHLHDLFPGETRNLTIEEIEGLRFDNL